MVLGLLNPWDTLLGGLGLLGASRSSWWPLVTPFGQVLPGISKHWQARATFLIFIRCHTCT